VCSAQKTVIKNINALVASHSKVIEKPVELHASGHFQTVRISFRLICLICFHRKICGLFMNSPKIYIYLFGSTDEKDEFFRSSTHPFFSLLSGLVVVVVKQPVSPSEKIVQTWGVCAWSPSPCWQDVTWRLLSEAEIDFPCQIKASACLEGAVQGSRILASCECSYLSICCGAQGSLAFTSATA
jgi:hypothetical protein